MGLPKHYIRTDTNKVELVNFRCFTSFEDLTPFSRGVGAMTTYLGWHPGERIPAPYENPAEYVKRRNELSAEVFGPRIHRNLPAAMFNTFIKSNFKESTYFFLRRNGSYWKRFNPTAVRQGITNLQKIHELESDRLEHLIPVAMNLGMSPSEGRKHFGKSLWKKIANNSKTRNKLLFDIYRVCDSEMNFDFELALSLRSGILENLSNMNYVSFVGILAGKLAPRIVDYSRTRHLVGDTVRMASQLGEEVNCGWSLKRWKKEHDQFARALLEKRYSPEPFTSEHVEEIDGFTFTRLVSPLEIAEEGSEMRHCVSSYSGPATRGTYEIYKVETCSERATLGLYVDSEGNLKLDQLYGPCNFPVSESMRMAATRFVVEENIGEDSIGRRSGRAATRSNQDTRSVVDPIGAGGLEFPF